jgi:hypothetical protein
MSTLCRAGRRWQKYGRAETSAPKAFGVLPGLSFCHPSARQACRAIAVAATAGRTVSQSVAAIWRMARAKLMPFELFRGYSVIVNPSDRSGIRQSVKAGQTMINIVKYKLFGQDDNQILSKYFKVNDLQSE